MVETTPLILKRNPLTQSILAFLLLIEFNVFLNVPIPFFHELSNTALLIIQVVFLFFYVAKSLKEGSFSKLLFLVLLIMIVPFISAYQAMAVFKQPFIYGLLADRGKFYIISALMLTYALEKDWFTIYDLESVVKKVAIPYFLISLFLYAFVPPSLFAGTSFAVMSTNKGVKYNINHFFTIFLFFYSIYKFNFERNKKYLLIAVAVLGYLIVFVKGRSLLAAIFMGILYFIVFQLSYKKKIFFVSGSLLGGVLFLSVGILFFSGTLSSIFQLFSSGLNVFIGGEVTDGSAASRIDQAAIAWEGIDQHPWLGNGFVSSRWNEGFGGLFEHFFPSDIGWLGILYLNGIVGFLILIIPFILPFKYGIRVEKSSRDTFMVTIQTFLVYLFFHNIFAGFAVKKIGVIAFFFGIMYYYKYIHPSKVNNLASVEEANEQEFQLKESHS